MHMGDLVHDDKWRKVCDIAEEPDFPKSVVHGVGISSPSVSKPWTEEQLTSLSSRRLMRNFFTDRTPTLITMVRNLCFTVGTRKWHFPLSQILGNDISNFVAFIILTSLSPRRLLIRSRPNITCAPVSSSMTALVIYIHCYIHIVMKHTWFMTVCILIFGYLPYLH